MVKMVRYFTKWSPKADTEIKLLLFVLEEEKNPLIQFRRGYKSKTFERNFSNSWPIKRGTDY